MRSVITRAASIAVALVILSVMCLAPVTAATAAQAPLIIVNSIGEVPLIKDAGTENAVEVYPAYNGDEEALQSTLTAAFIAGFARLIYDNQSFGAFLQTGKNWNGFCDEVLPEVYTLLDPISYNADGTPKYADVTNETYALSLDNYAEDEREEMATVFGELMGEKIGLDKVYVFGYDWRADPIASGAQLDSFIDDVKAETGSSKVNILALGIGANVVLSYLSENAPLNDYADVKNVVFADAAWQGTSLAGDLFTGNIALTVYTFENFLVQMADGSLLSYISAAAISTIFTWQGGTAEWFPEIEYDLGAMLPRIYSDIIDPIFSGMPGMWSLVPSSYYEEAKAFMFPDGMAPELETVTDAYHGIQADAKNVISDAMDAGVNFSTVSGYNYQLLPIGNGVEDQKYGNFNNSDQMVDTKYSSGGATCTNHLKEFPQGYTESKYDGYNHVSPDLKVDASTCMFPENAWFIKNHEHLVYEKENGGTDLIVWLLSNQKPVTIRTDVENYPQYIVLDTFDNIVVPAVRAENYLKGDVDNNGVVSTDDARFALRNAIGLVGMDSYQLSKADLDGNGKVSTEEARTMLRMALGLEAYVYVEAPADDAA